VEWWFRQRTGLLPSARRWKGREQTHSNAQYSPWDLGVSAKATPVRVAVHDVKKGLFSVWLVCTIILHKRVSPVTCLVSPTVNLRHTKLRVEHLLVSVQKGRKVFDSLFVGVAYFAGQVQRAEGEACRPNSPTT
jgi:hypothetical protein